MGHPKREYNLFLKTFSNVIIELVSASWGGRVRACRLHSSRSAAGHTDLIVIHFPVTPESFSSTWPRLWSGGELWMTAAG